MKKLVEAEMDGTAMAKQVDTLKRTLRKMERVRLGYGWWASISGCSGMLINWSSRPMKCPNDHFTELLQHPLLGDMGSVCMCI